MLFSEGVRSHLYKLALWGNVQTTALFNILTLYKLFTLTVYGKEKSLFEISEKSELVFIFTEKKWKKKKNMPPILIAELSLFWWFISYQHFSGRPFHVFGSLCTDISLHNYLIQINKILNFCLWSALVELVFMLGFDIWHLLEKMW